MHIHTQHSDGRSSVREVLEHARARARLDVIAITDHDTIDGAMEALAMSADYGVEVVVGEEVTSREGHVIGLYLGRPVPPGMSAGDTVAAIHQQGGLAIAAHPFFSRQGYLAEVGRVPMGIGGGLLAVPFDGVETVNSFPQLIWANRRAARTVRSNPWLSAVGGSDAHLVQAVGKGYTSFPGHTAADLREAIERRQTRAVGRLYGPRLLLAYANILRDERRSRRRRSAATAGTR